jgi:hypothetical protein
MPQDRRVQLQVHARALHQMLAKSSFSQLLQQPPTQQLTAMQAALIAACCTLLRHLLDCLPVKGASTARQMLRTLLHEKAVQSVGTLLTWLQQQPQTLQLARMAQPVGSSNTLEAMWLLCCSIMRQMEVVTSGLGAAEAAPLVVTFTAQLQQSGKL